MRRIVIIIVLGLLGTGAVGIDVRDAARIAGQGSSRLQGIGLVIGLQGTGDSGQELVLARPLARLLENSGLPIGSIEELAAARSAALVMVTCETPAEGARVDDRLDVSVSVLYSASSLEGGMLFLTPLTGPFPGSGVYAMADGKVDLLSSELPTRGRVRLGAQMVREIPAPEIHEGFDLILHPRYVGHQSARHLALRINDESRFRRDTAGDPSPDPIARAINDRTVRIRIPTGRRATKAEFIADIMSTSIDPAQMRLPARVVISRESGAIVVTGDVEISLVAVAHKNLVIRRIEPAPEPTEQNPRVRTENAIAIGSGRERERSKLDDLLEAFKALSVPTDDQIQIIEMLHRSGQLHAELVFD